MRFFNTEIFLSLKSPFAAQVTVKASVDSEVVCSLTGSEAPEKKFYLTSITFT